MKSYYQQVTAKIVISDNINTVSKSFNAPYSVESFGY
jgi:hypothetical protein